MDLAIGVMPLKKSGQITVLYSILTDLEGSSMLKKFSFILFVLVLMSNMAYSDKKQVNKLKKGQKYIGETEKNLAPIQNNKRLNKKSSQDAILLFDEADSLIGIPPSNPKKDKNKKQK